MDDNSVYRDMFLEESDEYLQLMNEGVLSLELDSKDKDALGKVFRAAHTLKGMSATMGYDSMAELTHAMESALELFKDDSFVVDALFIDLIFKCLDRLSGIVEKIRDGDYTNTYIDDLVDLLSAILDGEYGESIEDDIFYDDESNSNVISFALDSGYNAFGINVTLEKGSMIKGARAYLVVNRLENHGEVIHTNPSAELLEEGKFDDSFQMTYLTHMSSDEVYAIIDGISEIENIEVTKLEAVSGTVEELINDEEVGSDNANERKIEEIEVVNKKSNPTINHSIRVDLDRLDAFMNLVSELVVYRNQLEDIGLSLNLERISEPLSNVSRITSELQELVLNIRMQPVSTVFNRFPRMVRDLSKELNKELSFEIEGDDTELDKTVVAEIGEPLMHIIRNAIDHGIESLDERMSLGKPKVAKLRLTAHQEGNQVVITVGDDGRGLDVNKIRESANSKGIKTSGMSDDDIRALIFSSGFTTKTEVTNISGRGVGMDVVKQKITSLGGVIDIVSEVNKGTIFFIKLPLTLSIMKALLVDVSGEVYAIPISFVDRVIRVKDFELQHYSNNNVYTYKDKVIKVIDLSKKFGLPNSNAKKHLVIVKVDEKYYGLMVDRLDGQKEIIIKKLNAILGDVKECLGATILSNGDVALILDIGNLCN